MSRAFSARSRSIKIKHSSLCSSERRQSTIRLATPKAASRCRSGQIFRRTSSRTSASFRSAFVAMAPEVTGEHSRTGGTSSPHDLLCILSTGRPPAERIRTGYRFATSPPACFQAVFRTPGPDRQVGTGPSTGYQQCLSSNRRRRCSTVRLQGRPPQSVSPRWGPQMQPKQQGTDTAVLFKRMVFFSLEMDWCFGRLADLGIGRAERLALLGFPSRIPWACPARV